MAGDQTDDLDELRERVQVLEAGLGLADTFSIPPDVRALVRVGRTVDAVRELRQKASGRLSLVAATRMVDALQRMTQ